MRPGKNEKINKMPGTSEFNLANQALTLNESLLQSDNSNELCEHENGFFRPLNHLYSHFIASSYHYQYLDETKTVWEEVGFLPPVVYQHVVEILHQLSMYGESEKSSLLLSILNISKNQDKNDSYYVIDPVRLKHSAREYGIPISDRNYTDIARAVTKAIVNEYYPGYMKNSILNHDSDENHPNLNFTKNHAGEGRINEITV